MYFFKLNLGLLQGKKRTIKLLLLKVALYFKINIKTISGRPLSYFLFYFLFQRYSNSERKEKTNAFQAVRSVSLASSHHQPTTHGCPVSRPLRLPPSLPPSLSSVFPMKTCEENVKTGPHATNSRPTGMLIGGGVFYL